MLNAHGHEYAQLGELRIHVERAAVSLNECIRVRLFKVRLLRIIQIALQLVDDGQRMLAPLGRALVVQVENGGYFLGRARALVHAARNVDGSRNDAVAVLASERLVLRNLLVVAQRAVNDHFRNAGVGRRVFNALKFVVQRLFGVRHGLPLRVPPDFAHFIAGCPLAQHLAPVRGLQQQRVHGHAAPRGVRHLIVVRAIKPPLRRIIQRVLVNDAAFGIGAGCEPVVRDHQAGLTHVAHLAISRRVVHALHATSDTNDRDTRDSANPGAKFSAARFFIALQNQRLQFRPQFIPIHLCAGVGFILMCPTQ